jgi:hypothetical protein
MRSGIAPPGAHRHQASAIPARRVQQTTVARTSRAPASLRSIDE